MEYTFIKDFGFFKEGDTLTWDKELNAFTLDIEDENGFRSAMIDEKSAENMYNNNLLSVAITSPSEELNKINSTIGFIDGLIEQYDKDYTEVMDKYSEGKVPPCVKLEAETVYYNLTKVLNKIKEELINE